MKNPLGWIRLLSIIIALIPALLSAWWGRALVRMTEDAAIGERLLVHRRRMICVTTIVVVILAAGMPQTLVWSIPLLILSRAIAAFPARRALFDETWNLGEYLIGVFRLYAALLGFWILLAACPFLTSVDHWWHSILIFAILASWNWWYAGAVLRLLGSRPLHSETLEAQFAKVIERSKAPVPSVWRAGPAGATYANAIALPSLRRPSIVISETLLDRLSEEETTAIFAHEIAHLEHYTPSRLWLEHLAGLILISAGTFLIPFIRSAAQPSVPMHVIWPVFILFCLAFKARHAQANEQASDLRAVELCGNAEALVNGLVKLHAIGRLPRRWELKMEASATHPSLAHRIRAIRNATPAPPESQWCEIFRTAENDVFVALHESGLQQFRGVPAGSAETRETLQSAAGAFTSIRFSQIAELRVAAKGRSDPELILVERNGKRLALRMQAEDLPRLQRTLDRVDILLPPAPKKLFTGQSLTSAAAGAAALAALIGAQLWSVTIVALAASFRPTVRLISAAAMVSALSLVLVLTRGTLELGQKLIVMIGILPLAATALWMGFRSRNEDSSATEHLPPWILWLFGAAAAVFLCAPWLLARGSLLSLSMMSKTAVAPVVLPFAAAVLLAREKKSSLRGLALLLGIAGCVAIALGTQWFRERIIRDPLATGFPEFTVSSIPSEEMAHFAVEPLASDLRLSPRGTRVAVRYGDSEDEGPSLYSVYGKDGIRRSTGEAMDLQFTDESHVLVLNATASGLVLNLVAEDKSTSSIWQSPSGTMRSGRLAVSPETGEWRILCYTREGNLIRFQGIPGKNSVDKTEWATPVPAERWASQGTSGSGPFAIWVYQRWKMNELTSLAALLSSHSGEYPLESRLFLGRQADTSLVARSGTQLTCLDPPVGEDEPACLAYYDGRTSVLTLDPAKAAIQALGSLPGNVWAHASCNSQIVMLSLKGEPVLLNLRKPHLFRFSTPAEVFSLGAASRTGIVATLARERDRPMLTISHINEDPIR